MEAKWSDNLFVVRFALGSGPDDLEYFSLDDPGDAYALEDKLMNDDSGGWIFYKRIAGLLLKCIKTLEAMK